MSRSIIALLILALPVFAEAPAGGQDRPSNWPQWRGPGSDGLAPDSDPPVEWSETKNVRWKVEIPGAGSATPVVWGDKLFVLTAVNTGKKPAGGAAVPEPPAQGRGMSIASPGTLHKFEVICLDRMSGKTLWT